MRQPPLSSTVARPWTTTNTFHVTIVALLLIGGVLIMGRVPRARDSEAVYLAIVSGDVDALRQLIVQDADLDAPDHLGYTPLALSAAAGQTDAVKWLLESGANVDEPHPQLGTPLMLALGNGHVAVARILLEHGADVNMGCEGWDPLGSAVRSNEPACLDLVLDAGASLHREGRRCSLLTLASLDGDTRLLKRLLEAGADPNQPDADGMTPLHNAIECGATEAARLLLLAGADPYRAEADGRTPYIVAQQRGRPELLSPRTPERTAGILPSSTAP